MRSGFIFLILSTLFVAGLAAFSTGQIWTSDIHSRWRPNSKPPTTFKHSITLYAARREYESFQIVIRQNTSSSVSVSDFSIGDLTSTSGARIAASNINIYREMFVNVNRGSSPSAATLSAGYFADPLIPYKDDATGQRPSSSAKYKCVPFSTSSSFPVIPYLVDVFVPPGTASGRYTGSIGVTTNRGSETIRIYLYVWNFELPLKATQQSAMGVWGPNENWIPQPNTQQMKNLFVMMLKHRVSPEKASWHAKVNNDNAISWLRDNYGLQTGAYSYFAAAIDCKLSRSAPSDSDVLDYIREMKDAGITVLGHAFDEISKCGPDIMNAVKQFGAVYNRTGVKLTSVMAMNPKLFGSVDVWVLAPYDLLDSTQVQLASQRQAAGDTVWSYTALSYDPTPTWTIDQPALSYRLRPTMNFAHKLTGLLYWTFAYWHADKPYEDVYTYGEIENRWDCPGDGIFIYPHGPIGTNTPAPSYRLKLLRDGMEDADYFYLMRQFNKTGAYSLANKLGGSWTAWNKISATSLKNVRLEVGNAIHRKQGGGVIRAESDTTSGGNSVNAVVIGLIVAAVVAAVLLGIALVYIFFVRQRFASSSSYGAMSANVDS